MKKLISLTLATVLAASALASCAASPKADASTSSGLADGAWLEERLGSMPANVTVGTADGLGIDMAEFESDGYFIRTTDGETVVCGKTADALDVAVRKYAKAVEAGREVADETFHEGARIKKLTIAGTDISEFTVVYRTEDGVRGAEAASEMARLIEASCRVAIPCAADTVTEHMISLAYCDDAELKETGYRYKVENGCVFIDGAWIIGLYNGVYRFLERELGWIDLTYGYSRLPDADAVDVPDGASFTEHAAFDYMYDRHIYTDTFPNARCSYAQGFHGIVMQADHKIGSWITSEEYVSVQPCYTDGYILEEVTENVLAYVGQHPGNDPLTIHMGEEDTPVFCTCKNCRAVMKEENGSQAGCVIRFVNAVSDAVAEAYPEENVAYSIFAYLETKRPPKSAARDNIYVTYCADFSCFKHSFNDPDCPGVPGRASNPEYADMIRGWGKVSKHVYVYYYILDNKLHQYNVITTFLDDMRFFRDAGMAGLCPEAHFYGRGFGKVQHNLMEHFNWDPDMTDEEYWDLVVRLLRDEFGDGAEHIREYIRLEHESVMGALCADCWTFTALEPCADQLNWRIYDRDFEKMRTQLEAAVPMANTAKQERRCELLLVPLYYMECYGSYYVATEAGDTEKLALLESYYEKITGILAKYGETFTWTHFSEPEILPPTLAECAEEYWENGGKRAAKYWQ